MLEKIISVRNVGRFASLRSDGGNETNLSKFSVVSAKNGAGKSTLCDILRSLGTRDGSFVEGRKRLGGVAAPAIDLLLADHQMAHFANGRWTPDNLPTVYVYDERFVRENVYLGDSITTSHRKRVYNLALGQEGVRLNNNVALAAAQYDSAKADFDNTESLLQRFVPRGYTIDTFRNLQRLEDEHQVSSLEQQLNASLSRRQLSERIKNRTLLNPLPTPELPAELDSILNETIDDMAMQAESRIRQHLNHHTNGSLPLSWLKTGFVSASGDVCPFCGQSLTMSRLFDEYGSYFSGAVKDFEQRRNVLKVNIQCAFGAESVQKIREILKTNADAIEWWKDACHLSIVEPVIDQNQLELKASEICQMLASVLTRKEGCLSDRVTLSPSEQGLWDSWSSVRMGIDAYNSAIERANQTIIECKHSVAEIDTTTLSNELEIAKCRRARYADEVVQAYADYDQKLQSKNAAQNAKTAANQALKEQSERLFSQYGDRINQHLGDFGVSFRVNNRGIDMRGGSGASGNLAITLCGANIDCSADAVSEPARTSLANTLSGGDRSTLALAYFLSFVEGAPDAERSIVVFDDPYQSQDRNRCQMTISKIERVANRVAQCIVFSHNQEFADWVFRIHLDENAKRMFTMSSVGEEVLLKRHNSSSNPTNSYVTDYKVIEGYINNPTDDQPQLLAIVRSMRQVLEAYLRNKFVGVFPENTWLGDMIGLMRGATDTVNPQLRRKAGDTLVEDLTNVNDYTSRYHHADRGDALAVPDAQELLTFAGKTLAILHK